MKIYKLYLFIQVTIFIFQSCGFESEQTIPVPKSESKMVVFADLPISDQTSSTVYVTRSRSVGENIQWDFNVGDSVKITDSTYFVNKGSPLLDFVKGAKAQLFDNDSLIIDYKPPFEGEKAIGFFGERKRLFKVNTQYTLRVTAPGFDTVTGTQILNTVVEINKIKLKIKSVRTTKEGLLSELSIEFDDPSLEKNVYRLDVGKYTVSKFKKPVFQRLTPIKIDPNAYDGKLINDNFFNGRKFTWRVGVDLGLEENAVIPKDSVVLNVYLTSSSPEYEKYIRNQEAKEASANNPFAEPVAPYTNLKGGYGFFIFSGRAFATLDVAE